MTFVAGIDGVSTPFFRHDTLDSAVFDESVGQEWAEEQPGSMHRAAAGWLSWGGSGRSFFSILGVVDRFDVVVVVV